MTPHEAKVLTAIVAGGKVTDNVFRKMVDALPVAVYTTDARGRLTYYNSAAVKLSGRTPELGSDKWCVTWKIFLADGTPLPHEKCPMAAALQGREIPAGMECIAERPDGTRFWFTPCPAVVRDTEGRIVGGINLLVDITDRKNAEFKVQEQFRAIVETTPECVKIIAPDGTLLFQNPSGLGLVGAASAGEVVGHSIYDLIAAEDRTRFSEFNARICGGERASMEFDLVGLQGVRRHMETYGTPFCQVDGSTVHLAIARDISERKRAESTSLLLSAIVDSSDDAIISKDLNGIITSWNQGAERLFGYTAAEAVGRPVAALLIPVDRQDEEPDILAKLRRGERVDHFETVRRRKDGGLLDISLTISPVKNAEGRVVGASKIARDISLRKRTEKAIQMLNSQLTADLAAMTRMQQLSTRLIQSHDCTQLLHEIITAAVEITDADMGNIQLVEDDRLKIVSHTGFESLFVKFFDRVASGEGVCGAAFEQRRRLIVEDVTRSPLFAGKPALAVLQQAGVAAVQSTPLITREGRVLGMLSTHYRAARRPSERDLRLLDILARQTADLIERTRAEAALLASENRFRAFVTASSDAVYRMSPDWSETRHLYGREFVASEDHPDRGWLKKYIPDEDQDRFMAAVHEAMRRKSIFEVEHRVMRSDGSTGWAFSRAIPLLDSQGEIIEWFGTARDITTRKQAEQQAREAAERFRFMAESMPQKIFTANAAGEVDYFNRQWMEFTGLPFDEIRGWGWTQFIHPDDLEGNVRVWRRSVETGEPFQFTHRFRRADGAYRWHLSRARAMRDGQGRISMWIGSNTEIHEQKQAEDELRRANADLEQFAFSASHDLQEPLRSVKIYSELLSQRYGNTLDAEGERFVRYVASGTTRMEALLRDLLTYSQVSKFDRPTEAASAAEALEQALSNLAGAIAETGAIVQAEPLPSLPVHHTHLQQLFQNIIGNAIKYRCPERPPVVRVSAERRSGQWLFAISDNGIGIDPQYKENIFGLFKRLHTSDQYSGTGIGLAICQRVVDRYHGRIWVDSEPGRGSTFCFTLPVR